MAYSRIEYLQSLNKMRNSYQTSGGNSGINTTDDSTNVGNELSSFAYMNTSIPSPEQAITTKDGAKGNGFTRTVDTVKSAGSNVVEGVFNFLDDIFDFAVGIAGGVSGVIGGLSSIGTDGFEAGWNKGNKWASDLIQADWQNYATDVINQADVFGELLGGRIFSGEWADNFSKIGTGEPTQQIHKNSWSNEWGEFGQTAQNVAQGIGYVLPSIALGIVTGGSSVATQTAIQSAVAGAGAMGSGMETALKDGATYGRALAYGGVKGTISAVETAITYGIGGSVANSTGKGVVGKGSAWVGKQIFNLSKSKGAEVFASKAVEIATRAGISYGKSMINQLSDPILKSIYDSGKTIEEAYGTNEKVKQFVARCSSNALSSAVTSAIITSSREVFDLARRGSDGYMAKYYYEQARNAEMHVEKELKSINDKLLSGKITNEKAQQMLQKLGRYVSTNERYGKLALEYTEKVVYTAKEKSSTTVNGQKVKDSKTDYGANKDVIKGVTTLGIRQKMLAKFLDIKNATSTSKDSVTLISNNGDTDVTVSKDGIGEINYTEKSGQTYSVSLRYGDNGEVTLTPNKSTILDAITIVNSSKVGDKFNIELKGKDIGLSNYDGISKQLTIKSSTITKTSSLDVLTSITENSKNNYVLDNGNQYKIVKPIDTNDITKYGVITVNKATNEVTDISVSNYVSTTTKYKIMPKQDIDKVMSTKLVDKSGSVIEYGYQPEANSIDRVTFFPQKGGGIYIYSKNVLKADSLAKSIPFSKASKTFNIPASLEKTYSRYVSDKNPFKVIEYIAKRNGIEPRDVLQKLGYDSIQLTNGDVITAFPENVLAKGELQYGKKSGSYGYSDLVRRFGSESAVKELQGYINENGSKHQTSESRQKYSELIKQLNAYQEVEIDNEKVGKISQKEYTPEMKEIASQAKKMGAEVTFAVHIDEDNRFSINGFTNGRKITLFFDRGDNAYPHERNHFIIGEKFALIITPAGKKYEQWKSENASTYKAICEELSGNARYADYVEEDVFDEEVLVQCIDGVFDDYLDDASKKVFADIEKDILSVETISFAKAHQMAEDALTDTTSNVIKYKAGDTKKDYNVAVSPYRSTNVNEDTVKGVRAKAEASFIKKVDKIANAIGIKAEYAKVIGGFTSSVGRYAGENVTEASYSYMLKHASDKDAELFACLVADSGFETQEASIRTTYVSKKKSNGEEIELLCAKNKTDDITKLLKDSGIKDFSYFDENGIIRIQVIEDFGDLKGTVSNVQTFIKEAFKKGLLNEQETERNYIKSDYYSPDVRRDVYRNWLENKDREQNWERNNLLEQAVSRVEAEIKTSPYKQELTTIYKEQLDKIDLSKVTFDEITDNNQTKTVIHRDANTEPLFKAGELIHKITEVEKPFVIKFLKDVSKQFDFDYSKETSQSLQKSVRSIADRLYRNIRDGLGTNPYKLNDWFRSTFIMKGNDIKNVRRLKEYLTPYLINPNYSVKDTNFGYKGVHLQVGFQDLPLEIQIHTKQSWDIKLQQDAIYDKWRSHVPQTDSEKAEYALDIAKSKELGEQVGDDFKKIISLAKGESKPTKIISDIKANSSTTLIEAGADVSKPAKYRIDTIKKAFETAIRETFPDVEKYDIAFKDVKQAFAELNLSRPKDRDIAIQNIIKSIDNTSIKLPTEKTSFKLKELTSLEQEEKLTEIINNALSGKAEPTALAKWAKSLHLEKLENQENIRHVKLQRRLQRRIASAKKSNYTAPIAELTVFENIIKDVPLVWDNKSAYSFAERVLAYYNEDTLSKLGNGIFFDQNIRSNAELLQTAIKSGSHLSAQARLIANNILQLLVNNTAVVEESIRNVTRQTASHDIHIVQALGGGSGAGASGNNTPDIIGKIKGLFGNAEASVMSPYDFFKRYMPNTELTKLIERTIDYTNEQLKWTNELRNKILPNEVRKLFRTKVVFKGKTYRVYRLLDIYNASLTLGEKFFNAKGADRSPDTRRREIVYTEEDIAELKTVLEPYLEANDAFLKRLSEDAGGFIKKKYYEDTNTELVMLDEGEIYYPINRISDIYSGIKQGGIPISIDLSMFTERVNSRADVDFSKGLINRIDNYIDQAVRRLVWQPFIKELSTLLNTRVYNTTLYKEIEKNFIGAKEEIELLVRQVMNVPYETKVTGFGKALGSIVRNMNAVRVSTFQAGFRTLSSAPAFAMYFGANIGAKGIIREVLNGGVLAYKKNYDILVNNSEYFKNRFSLGDVVMAESATNIQNKISKYTGVFMTGGDCGAHVGLGFAMAQEEATEEGYGKPYTEANNKRTVKLLEQASMATQPTREIGRVAGFRYGEGVKKYLFGLYGSMKQAFYNGLVNPIVDILTYKKKEKGLVQKITEHTQKAEDYAQKANEAEKRMNEATDDEEFKEAKKEYEENKRNQESHEKAKKDTEEFYDNFKKEHTTKKMWDRVSGGVAGLLFSSLAYVGINAVIKHLEGKKKLSDVTAKDIAVGTIEQSFLNSMPYLSTFYNSIKNNTDLSIATADNINNTIEAVKNFVEALESSDGGKISGSILQMAEELTQYFGIPLASVLKLVNGTWYNIDPDSNLELRNWLGMLSESKLKSNYTSAYKNGSKEEALANLSVWTYKYSISTSDNVLNEIYRLNTKGYTGVSPSVIATTYTDESGNKVKYKTGEINAFKNAYSLASSQASKLVSSKEYASLDDEYKAKSLSRLYSAYKEYATYKRSGTAPTSKLGKLLQITNGNIDLAKYIASLQKLSVITASGNNTKKTNVIKAINGISGLNKAEKLLLAYLCGYNATETNKKTLSLFLVQKGASIKSINELLE